MGITVKGLDKAIQDLKAKGKEAETIIKNRIEDTATRIELDAKSNAPSQYEDSILNISQRIDKIRLNKGFTFKVGIQSANDFDAYVEFGTGLSAKQILNRPDYTPEIRQLALTFFKNGEGRLIGKPYLFPAYFKNTRNLVELLKNDLEQL